jgi:hypothetical protein
MPVEHLSRIFSLLSLISPKQEYAKTIEKKKDHKIDDEEVHNSW